jgi:carboxymethylenebutenolidase
MSLQGEPVDVPVADGGVLRAELFAPDTTGPLPGVLVLHESFGLNDDIRRIARRFVGAGYVAMTPSLYSHGWRIVCLSRVMVDLVRGSIAREIADILARRVRRSRGETRSTPSGSRWPASATEGASP